MQQHIDTLQINDFINNMKSTQQAFTDLMDQRDQAQQNQNDELNLKDCIQALEDCIIGAISIMQAMFSKLEESDKSTVNGLLDQISDIMDAARERRNAQFFSFF